MLKRLFVIFIILIVSLNIFIPAVYAVLPDFATLESTSDNVKVTKEKTYKTEESSIHTNASPVFSFKSEAQVLMEATTGEIIYANNENEKLYPASVTKIMTLLLIMEQIDSGNLKYTDTVTCSEAASKMGGSQIWFKPGESLTIDEALKCICVVSANDVCYAMGELIGGSNENFVQMMNNKAKELKMVNTNFMNVHGIDEEGHYTTAKDIAIMSRELITKHPDIYKYTTIWMDNIRGGTFELANTNKLLKTYEGITGLKTGSTSQAGFNLSATATRNGLSLIAVVLKAPSSAIRNEEITQLLNYGFSTYSSTKLGAKGDVEGVITINKHIGEKVNVVLKQDEYLICKKGENKEYEKIIEFDNIITAPISENTVVGRLKYIDKEGNNIHETDLVVQNEITKSTLKEYIKYIISIYSIKELKNK